MATRAEKVETFKALHVKGQPLELYNIWDAGSAKAVAKAGAPAVATGSWSVAAGQGYGDGEKMPFDEVLYVLRRIVDSVDLPVSLDMEGGYGIEPAAVAASAMRAVDAGAVGFNFEDQVVGSADLYSVEDQARRIAAIRQALQAAGTDAFINARTDIFLKAKPDTHTEEMVDAAIARVKAYAEAGASGFFVPGLTNEAFIGSVSEASPLPVNIMALPGGPSSTRLAELGVSRISHGPFPYRIMIKAVEDAARAIYQG